MHSCKGSASARSMMCTASPAADFGSWFSGPADAARTSAPARAPLIELLVASRQLGADCSKDELQEQRERATAHVDSLRTRAREFKEQLTATKRDMRRAGRTLKTYEVRQRLVDDIQSACMLFACSYCSACRNMCMSFGDQLLMLSSNNPLVRASSCWRPTCRPRSDSSPSPPNSHSSSNRSLSNSSSRRLKSPQHWRTSATMLCCASWRRLRTRYAEPVA